MLNCLYIVTYINCYAYLQLFDCVTSVLYQLYKSLWVCMCMCACVPLYESECVNVDVHA